MSAYRRLPPIHTIIIISRLVVFEDALEQAITDGLRRAHQDAARLLDRFNTGRAIPSAPAAALVSCIRRTIGEARAVITQNFG